MSEFFSEAWLQAYREAWNQEPGLRDALARVGFTARVGFGMIDEKEPRGVLTVVDGTVTATGPGDGRALDWDLRAPAEVWQRWLANPPGMIALGAAYTVGDLRFVAGDYAGMIKDSRLAGPFVKSFQVMARITGGLDSSLSKKGGAYVEKNGSVSP